MKFEEWKLAVSDVLLLLFFNSEPSLAERKALATAVGKQEAAQRLLGQCYCTLVLGLGLQDKHHMGCGR